MADEPKKKHHVPCSMTTDRTHTFGAGTVGARHCPHHGEAEVSR